MKKRVISFIMLIALLTTVCFATENSIKFNDVLADDWFFEDIIYVQENGLMNGIGDEAFGPDLTTTRGMVITVLWRLDGEKICNYFMTFEDVESNQWYTEAIRWATSEKIVKGYDNVLFGTNDLITREQLATMLYRYAEYKGIDIGKLTENINTLSFDDIFEVSEWATEGMHFCLATGLIKGMTENKIEPKGLATRAQLAAIFRRLDENVLTEKESVKHTVTFNLGYDEKILETKEVLDGEKVVSPKSPSRSGYTFAGWYDKEKSGSKFDFDEEILSDVVIYAHWNKKSSGGGSYTPPAPTKYTVTFDLNGIGSAIAPQTIIKGGKVTKPVDPTDTVHTFEGWYKDSGYTTEWDFDNDAITEDTTLYAKWTRTLGSILNTVQNFPSTTDNAFGEKVPTAWVKTIDNTYKCYIINRGKTAEALTLNGGSVNPLSCRISEPFTKIGGEYVFEYKSGANSYGLFTLNMTEGGVLTSIEYDGTNTTYDEYSGTYEPAVSVPVTGISLDLINATLEVGDNLTLHTTITPDNATNNNVTWSSSNDTIVTVDNDGKITANAFGTAIITATTVDGSKTATCTVTVNELKTIEEIISVYGQNFPNSNETGWIESNSAHKMYYKDGTLYIDSNTIVDGADNALKDNGGYKYYDGSNTIIFLLDGEILTSIQYSNENDEQYNGTYNPVTTYTVTFDLNGHGDSAPNAQTIAENGKVSKPTPAPTATDYTFVGWYKDDDAWDFDNDTVTEDTTLYAKWIGEEACLAAGTMITMADGNLKPVEEIKVGDEVVTFNHETGEKSYAKVFDYYEYEELRDGGITLHFSNNNDVTVVTGHGFYSKQDQKYVVITPQNFNDYVGKEFFNLTEMRWETLEGATICNEKLRTFIVVTEKDMNCVANNMLAAEDGIYLAFINCLDFDANMKVDVAKKQEDIERWKLYTYDEVKYLTKEAFEALNMQYRNIAIGKGLITEELIQMAIEMAMDMDPSNLRLELME